MRKMLVAMAKDPRVLLIKLGDRLHNMRTVAAMPEANQKRTAQETLDIYAPLAHRFGIASIKWQLEDLSFAALHPRRYAQIEQMVASRAPERDIYLAQVEEQVQERLVAARIEAQVTGRPKHLYSIYEKMVLKNKEFDEIYDLVGVRVIVSSVKDCWAALGAIHGTWAPIQGRFKDYINTPKFNLYQSLHTTVVGPQGKALEVQIRTSEMHSRAERGIAAHWGYKENASSADVAWLQRIVDWSAESTDPAEFLEGLKLDLETDEVFVFTPKGDVLALPIGATPVDFAYSIHTEVGHRCIGAHVQRAARPARLQAHIGRQRRDLHVEGAFRGAEPGLAKPGGDATGEKQDPPVVQPGAARGRHGERTGGARQGVAQGGPPVTEVDGQRAAQERQRRHALRRPGGPVRIDRRGPRIGPGRRAASARELRGGDQDVQLPSTVRQPRRAASRQGIGLHVEGLDDVMVRLARCCTPVPGDEIIGFVTRGRGVSVHRSDCANAAALAAGEVGRLIEVEWDRDRPGSFLAALEIKALDRTRLGVDVWKVLSDHHLNILRSDSHTGADRVSKMRFEFELADPAHLESVLGALKRVDSVYDAYRALPGSGNGGRGPS